MGEDPFRVVDADLTDRLLPPDPELDDVLAANASAGLPAIDVSPLQGRFLHLIARMIGARRILEIGTLGGTSTIWLGRALPDGGMVTTLEADAGHARVARANIDRAGLSDRVDLRIGPALDSLPSIEAENGDAFDLVFIDADKPSYPAYLDWSLRLSRSGAVIIADNVVRRGAVTDANSADPRVQGVRRFIDMMAAEPRLSATAIQTVGLKGWDGFALAMVV